MEPLFCLECGTGEGQAPRGRQNRPASPPGTGWLWTHWRLRRPWARRPWAGARKRAFGLGLTRTHPGPPGPYFLACVGRDGSGPEGCEDLLVHWCSFPSRGVPPHDLSGPPTRGLVAPLGVLARLWTACGLGMVCPHQLPRGL